MLPLLLALACGSKTPQDSEAWPPPGDSDDQSGDPGPEGHEYTSYEGSVRFQSGWDPDIAARACDLTWQTTGAPTDLCEDCLWTFEIEATLDPALSSYDESCGFEAEDADFTWGLGMSLDWYDYGSPVIWYYLPDYRYWYPQWVASWSYPEVVFGGGAYEEEFIYQEESWYYTNYWRGSADVR